jgi:hypothetical protein
MCLSYLLGSVWMKIGDRVKFHTCWGIFLGPILARSAANPAITSMPRTLYFMRDITHPLYRSDNTPQFVAEYCTTLPMAE